MNFPVWISYLQTIDPAASVSRMESWTLWSAAAVDFLTWMGMIVIGLGALVCIYRIALGPHLADRAIGADTLSTYLIGLVLLLTILIGNLIFFDGVLVLALLGFAGTVAMAQYLGRQVQSRRHRANDPVPNAGEAQGKSIQP